MGKNSTKKPFELVVSPCYNIDGKVDFSHFSAKEESIWSDVPHR
jgi:hypothetical protein